MSTGLFFFACTWLGFVVLVALAVTVGRWMRFTDDVVKLARRDRRRAEQSGVVAD
jgi:hypothetical protein